MIHRIVTLLMAACLGYAARVSALQFNENVETLEITASGVRVLPLPEYVPVDVSLATAPAGTRAQVEIDRGPEPERVRVRAKVPQDGVPLRETIAVADPARHFAWALRRVLAMEGIDVSASTPRAANRSPQPESLSLLWTHRSPPLAEILKPMLKVSQNLYAETVARVLGDSSFAAGKRAVEETLTTMGIEPGTYVYADGSGLSRYNLVSAGALTRLLVFMSRHPSFSAFYDALPVAGVDGTLARRLGARGNVHAKTGSIANVRSLSGYVRAADGERLAFSMIANNFLGGSDAADRLQDSALVALAAFSRGSTSEKSSPSR